MELAIRKFVISHKVDHWESIIAKPAPEKSLQNKSEILKYNHVTEFLINFIHTTFWKVFISTTILLNFFITISAISQTIPFFIYLAISVHFTCFFFWIDFLAALAYKRVTRRDEDRRQIARRKFTLTIEGISLIPLSEIYLIKTSNPHELTFWCFRLVTLLRFYRVQYYLSQLATPGKHFWNIYFFSTLLYLLVLINVYCSVFIVWNRYEPIEINISGFTDSNLNEFLVALYFTLVTMLNIGFGDIVFNEDSRLWMCTLGMAIGFTTIRGVLTGVLATKFTNFEKDEAKYRHEYEATIKRLKKIKTDKKVVKRLSENMKAIWLYRDGHLSPEPPIQILPESIQKELFFDINFGLLNRSVIFSMQPKAFLRSVSLLMKNYSYLPGDVISEPNESAHTMICIFSGVAEVLSSENAEIVLFSLTAGSIVGESNLFVSLPRQYWLKASTYVEAQLLLKEDFFRLALKYPDICSSIRTDMVNRLELPNNDMSEKEGGANFKDLLDILKESKRFVDLSRQNKSFKDKSKEKYKRSTLLSLYVVSENIPKVKTTPINLLRGKPWILRPNTFLTEIWRAINTLVILVVVFIYPYLAGFVRDISEETFMLLHIVEVIYIFDIIMQCTTAIKRKDHFTYFSKLREIITIKLKSPGFYVDILSTLNFTAYADLTSIKNKKYAVLLLSQNRVLRVWHIYTYFRDLESTWSVNLLFVRFLKYLTYLSLIVVWSGVTLYLEACPEEVCVKDRWFSRTEEKEIKNVDPEPLSEWPALMSLYWSCVTVTGVGYGDIVVAAVFDCVLISLWIVIGAFTLTYVMAEASATMKNLTRLRAQYQEEVFSVDRFMREYDIPWELQRRVRNFFQVQWNFDEGFTLRDPQVLKDITLAHKKILAADMLKRFLVIPFFRNASMEFLKTLIMNSKFRILPPDEIVVERGCVAREMFILDEGYCVTSEIDEPRIENTKIIKSVNAFGFAEMVLGIPVKLNVRTITHCKIITLDYYSYLRAVTIFPSTKLGIDEKIETNFAKKNLSGFQLLGIKPEIPEKNVERIWKQKKILSYPIINVYRFHQNLGIGYYEPFKIWGKLSFLKYILMPLVFAPNSKLLKIWSVIRITRALLFGALAPPYLALPHHHEFLYFYLFTLQVLGWIDMYMMFHISYYNEEGLLIVHPSKTAIYYLKGTFMIDFIIEFPTYTLIRNVVPSEKFAYILHATGLFKVLQVYKFFQACLYLENDVLRRTEVTKILKFVPLALLITNVVTGLLIMLECYSNQESERTNVANAKISKEFQKTIKDHCKLNHTDRYQPEDISVFKMYVIVFYWVTASMTTSGFGDLSAHNRAAMFITIVIVFLGIFLYGYMFASLTSNMISTYTSVTKYRRRLLHMSKFLKRSSISHDLHTRIQLHYEYNWKRTEGSKPQTMLAKVHTSLRESFMATMYEDTIKLVQSFEVAEKSILKIIGGFMDHIHFLCGETIVRHNDILEYIYVIHRGVVEVLDVDNQKVAIMGKGGMFGNISNKIFALSSVTIIARKNLEILRLETEPFFKALKVVSNSKSLLDYLTSQTTNYIKPLNAEEDNVMILNISQTALLDTLAYRVTIPLDIAPASGAGALKVKIKKFIRTLKNSIFIPPKEKFLGSVVLPDSFLSHCIAIMVFILGLISGLLSAYIFFYQDTSMMIIIISYVFDIFYFFKIPLSFTLSYYDKFGDYVVSKVKIKRRYLRSRYFVFDVISSVPLELISLSLSARWSSRVFTVLHLNRVIRFYCVDDYFASKSKALKANKIHLQLWWVMICIIVILQFTAGFWYFQACPFDQCQIDCWVIDRNISVHEKWQIYSTSVYFIVALFTTTGFGDISIYTVSELLTAISFMIFSQFCIVLLAGSMATVIYDQILDVIMYEKVISELTSTFKRLGLSKYQMVKAWHYFTSLWRFHTKEIPKFIRIAPYSMKCEIMFAMFGSHLSESYIFSTMEEAFLRQLAVAIERHIFFSGNYIVHQGDIDSTMYFIDKGQVSVLTIHPNLMETVHYTLKENDQFGTIQGLLPGKAHFFTYRADGTVEILSLSLNHWKHLLKYFPQSESEIYKRLQKLPYLQPVLEPPKIY